MDAVDMLNFALYDFRGEDEQDRILFAINTIISMPAGRLAKTYRGEAITMEGNCPVCDISAE